MFNLRISGLIMLPVVTSAFTFLAGVNHGAARLLWSIAAITGTSSMAVLAATKEKQVKAATDAAVAAKIELATTLNNAGQPLVRLLSDVAASSKGDERQSAARILIAKAVGIAYTNCGRQSPEFCRTRSVFYEFIDDDHLVRSYFEGRQDIPRPYFCSSRGDNDRLVLSWAKGSRAVKVPDVKEWPLPFEPTDRPYRTLLAAPARAGGKSYGILFVDSDRAHSLTEVDTGYVILLAGMLATALSLVDGNLLPLTNPHADDLCEHLPVRVKGMR